MTLLVTMIKTIKLIGERLVLETHVSCCGTCWLINLFLARGKWLKEMRCGISIQSRVLAGGSAVKYHDC